MPYPAIPIPRIIMKVLAWKISLYWIKNCVKVCFEDFPYWCLFITLTAPRTRHLYSLYFSWSPWSVWRFHSEVATIRSVPGPFWRFIRQLRPRLALSQRIVYRRPLIFIAPHPRPLLLPLFLSLSAVRNGPLTPPLFTFTFPICPLFRSFLPL